MGAWCLEVAVLTDVGRVRGVNEDTAAADGEYGIAVVADGMGGHRAGKVASHMARDIVLDGLRGGRVLPWKKPAQLVKRVLARANRSIVDAGRGTPAFRGMGTTLAVMLFRGRRVTLAHVGDTRVYRLRRGRLSPLTRDDSLLSDQVELGLISAREAAGSHNRHLVTRALGVREDLVVTLREEHVEAGDVFLACTDGLHDMVDDADIELIVDSLHMNLPLAAQHLVQLANDNGGFDNVSVALVKVVASRRQAKGKGWLGRLLGRTRRAA
jgi:protein phosphatase